MSNNISKNEGQLKPIGPRVFFLDYYMFSAYCAMNNEDLTSKLFKPRLLVFMLLTFFFMYLLELVSSAIFDINQLLINLNPFELDVLKSPLNPQSTPATVAMVVSLVITWKLYKKKETLNCVNYFQNKKYKTYGWGFILFIFFTSVSLGIIFREYPSLPVTIYLLLFLLIHLIGKNAKANS